MSTLEPSELRSRRRALGLTQAELAVRLAVSANTVARWERGELRIGQPRKVAQALARLERVSTRTPRSLTPAHHPKLQVKRHNLPTELNSFVGRRTEIIRLAERLTSARLLTLVGPGGVGKTRLALQVAASRIDTFADGVWLVELGRLADARMVASSIASVLDIRERGSTSLARTLVETLRDRELLLVLDNCEHVLNGCAEIAHDLLAGCPHLTVLATSREPLRVSAEMRWPVPPLSEAVQLFVERARAVQPDFVLTSDNESTIADVCAHLDRLPLAIELAAARIGSIPPRTLLSQLESSTGSLPILSGGPRDAPERQRALRATIAWSYDLLGPEERTLFRRMAPFRGCTFEAISAVCVQPASGGRTSSVDLPPLLVDPREAVASLVEESLLQAQEDEHGQVWFSMLETVREFALERLEASPEAEPVWRRFAWYYLKLAESSDGRPSTRQDVELHRLEREHGNYRAALDWCQARGYAEASLRLAVSLLWFWVVRGHLAEGRRRLESLLARFPLRSASAARITVHAQAVDALGRLAAMQGDLDGAEALEQQSLRLFTGQEQTDGMCTALEGLGMVARRRGDLPAARNFYARVVAALRPLQAMRADPIISMMLSHALSTEAQIAHEQGDDELAIASVREAIRLVELNADPVGSWPAWLYLARMLEDLGDLGAAQAHAEKALGYLEGDADRRGLGLALSELGSIATARGDLANAYVHLARSLQTNIELGDRGGIAFALDRLAALASAEGQYSRALRLAGAAAVQREQAGASPSKLDQQQIDRKLDSARRFLGGMAESAFATGRGMSMSDVLAEATAVDPTAGAPLPGTRPLLTARERQVALLVAAGQTNRQIASQLVVSEATAATHVQHILNKLDLQSRAQIAAWIAHAEARSSPGVPHATVSR